MPEPLEVAVRRMRRRERAVHPPKVSKEGYAECYLGKKVHVLNVYERCGHACAYCFVEWSWSPKTVVARENLVERVVRDLRRFYRGRRVVINMGSATDPYQPAEKRFGFMRRLIPLLKSCGASFYICTKSDLILRDLDLLAGYPNVWVGFTVTSLSQDFSRVFEPNAPNPARRIDAIQKLLEEGIRVVVRIDPIIPLANDGEAELEEVVKELRAVGVNHFVASTLKLDREGRILYGTSETPKWKKTLCQALLEWLGSEEKVEEFVKLFEEGEVLYGYRVPPLWYRKKVLEAVRRACGNALFTTCKMGIGLKNQLSTWIEDGEFRCACYAQKPTKIQPKYFL